MHSLDFFLNEGIMQGENFDDMGATGRVTARQVKLWRTTFCGPPVTTINPRHLL